MNASMNACRVEFKLLVEDYKAGGTVQERISLSRSLGLSRPHNGTYNMGDCGKIDNKNFVRKSLNLYYFFFLSVSFGALMYVL